VSVSLLSTIYKPAVVCVFTDNIPETNQCTEWAETTFLNRPLIGKFSGDAEWAEI